MTDQNKLNSFHVCVTINTMSLLSAVRASKVGAISCKVISINNYKHRILAAKKTSYCNTESEMNKRYIIIATREYKVPVLAVRHSGEFEECEASLSVQIKSVEHHSVVLAAMIHICFVLHIMK